MKKYIQHEKKSQVIDGKSKEKWNNKKKEKEKN